jgi:hypothetical protein
MTRARIAQRRIARIEALLRQHKRPRRVDGGRRDVLVAGAFGNALDAAVKVVVHDYAEDSRVKQT